MIVVTENLISWAGVQHRQLGAVAGNLVEAISQARTRLISCGLFTLQPLA